MRKREEVDRKESETLPLKEGLPYLDPSCEATEGLGLSRYLEFEVLRYIPSYGEEDELTECRVDFWGKGLALFSDWDCAEP